MVTKEEQFFSQIVGKPGSRGKKKPKLLLVTHILPDRPVFLKNLSKIIDVVAIFPKRKSINQDVYSKIKKKYNCLELPKTFFSDEKKVVSLITKLVGDDDFIISDIGGYFAQTATVIKKTFPCTFLGIVEDTENGFQKYEQTSLSNIPFYSVARSSLKYPEDILVAYSTVFSAEAILRERNQLLTGKKVTVIGYGKIGSHIVRDLIAKRAIVSIYDVSSVKLAHALAEGRNIISKNDIFTQSDIIFSVTGNKSLSNKDLLKFKGECYIFSITSSDDEFYLDEKFPGFKKSAFDPIGTTLKSEKSVIHLVNYGNAVNFLHGAVVGEFIYLVQAEIIRCIKNLINKNESSSNETSKKEREKIANVWLKYFR